MGTPNPTIRQSPAMWKMVPSCWNVISVSREKYSFSSGTTASGRQTFRDAREAAQVREHHHGMRAKVRARQQRAAKVARRRECGPPDAAKDSGGTSAAGLRDGVISSPS